jgi:hypothetical protein
VLEVQVNVGAALLLVIRKDSAVGWASPVAAFLQYFTRRTTGTRPRAWVKFRTCSEALRHWLRTRRVAKGARIASVKTGTAPISVASRSAVPPTRLETRTKESNMCASHWVY